MSHNNLGQDLRATASPTFANLTITGSISGAGSFAVATKTANYTLIATDKKILCKTNAFTITALPAATMNSTGLSTIEQRITNHYSNAGNSIIIDADGAETIDGAASIAIPPGVTVGIWSDGTELFTV